MENFFTSTKPFVIFAHTLGLFPMNFEGPARKGLLRLSYRGIVFACCSLLFVIYLVVGNILKPRRSLRDDPSFLEKILESSLYIELFSYIHLILYQMVKRHNIVRFLKLIDKVDEEVRFFQLINP